MSEPRWDIIAEDVIDAMTAGQMVQEAGLDARVRQHQYAPPGYVLVIDRARVDAMTVRSP